MTITASCELDHAGFRFGTKARTLERLTGRLSRARLCAQMIISSTEWSRARDHTINNIKTCFEPKPLAVRSSAVSEDRAENSNAGMFESVTGVACETGAIGRAVDTVIASYGADAGDQEILIQEMVSGVALSGVVLTRDLDTGGPYYVINYDDYSGRTDTVTSGAVSKIVMVHRARPEALRSARMRRLIEVVQEIEVVTGHAELDIEFCADRDMTVTILQVRPLAARRAWRDVSDADIDKALAKTRDRVGRMMTPPDSVVGARTAFAVMTDWNPAEMIGRTPRRLALSLYKDLITDQVWSEARARMGYRPVAHPLLVDFFDRPYIDVRLSLNSFLPAPLNRSLAHRLVDYQLARLIEEPALHDKVEFEIAITCRDLDFTNRGNQLRAAGFTATDVDSLGGDLGALTARALAAGRAGIERILAVTDYFPANGPPMETPPLDNAAELLTKTRQAGTLPFSILARHAFIAVSFLRSLCAREILSEAESLAFVQGVHTVAADIVADFGALAHGDIDRTVFLARYGHLRPGTYDILSPRYDEAPDLYLDNGGAQPVATPANVPFTLSARQHAAIGTCLQEAGYDIEPDALLDYMSAAIQAREQAKFAFTRGISDALRSIRSWGESLGLRRDDLSNISLGDMLAHRSDTGRLRSLAQQGRAAHRLSMATRLHHLITEPDDIDIVYPARGEPTFITARSVTAPGVTLVAHGEHDPIEGAVVLIESADPGFDWIFSRNIAGLVTQYGGANSHMAIRCAEFGLPAAIGCGERTFEALKKSLLVELDCRARRLAAH